MTSDLKLVTVPRDLYYHEVTYVRGLEAEIERLEEVVTRLHKEKRELRAEIERLTAAREMMQLDAEKYRDETKTLRAEVERLQRLNELWREDYRVAAAEIVRLRAALHNIELRYDTDSDPYEMVEIARAALKPKP